MTFSNFYMNGVLIKPIARIYTDFHDKFGIPRQSGRAPSLTGRIVFEPEYRNETALRGIEDFSHLWLIFDFSLAHTEGWSPTVRPPRLGGNKRLGVFATRSPFRPNSIGLSSVKLERLEKSKEDGLVLVVSGVDLLNETPIYDIKPYLPYTDCHMDAVGGFGEDFVNYKLDVDFSNELLEIIPEDKRCAVIECLADDPRPAYQDDSNRVYSLCFSEFEIKFKVCLNVLTVIEVKKQ